MPSYELTVIIERDRGGYVSLCPELDIARQGDTAAQARESLVEALELFLARADASEIRERLHDELYVTRLQVAVG